MKIFILFILKNNINTSIFFNQMIDYLNKNKSFYNFKISNNNEERIFDEKNTYL